MSNLSQESALHNVRFGQPDVLVQVNDFRILLLHLRQLVVVVVVAADDVGQRHGTSWRETFAEPRRCWKEV